MVPNTRLFLSARTIHFPRLDKLPLASLLTLALTGCGDDGMTSATIDPETTSSTGTGTETTDAPTTGGPTTGGPPANTTEDEENHTVASSTSLEPTTDDLTGTSATTDVTTGDTESTGTTDTSTSTSTSTGDTSTSTGDTSTSTGDEPPPDCVLESLVHAPPPTTIDGLPAVPIDILAIEGQLHFDLATNTAHADATMTFQLGPDGGMPIFDLRQTISAATLDGEPLDPALMQSHNFGKGLTLGFRILEQELEACSQHTLTLSYPVTLPNAPAAGGFYWLEAPDRLFFDIWLSDLNPGRYLEQWLPANLPFDRQPVSLGITMSGAGTPHTLISTAEVEELGEHQWQLEFPATSTAMGPLVVIVPSTDVTAATGVHPAVNGQNIPYWVYLHKSTQMPIADLEADLAVYIDKFVTSIGDYPHAGMTAYVGAAMRSMEYDGGTTTKPEDFEHEVFHSWWARGVRPATYADGWIDEAWDMYNTEIGLSFTSEPFDWNAPAAVLFDPHPFARDTPDNSYTHGRRVFAGLAAIVGVEGLRSIMADLYASIEPLGSVTTAMLERHLYCEGDEQPEIRQAFWRFVYGQAGEAPAPPIDYCG